MRQWLPNPKFLIRTQKTVNNIFLKSDSLLLLATILDCNKKKTAVTYQLEEMDEKDEKETEYIETLSCFDLHKRKVKINGLSVYK